MKKTILITGATDGIGLHAAHKFAELGHTLLIHGRNADKLSQVVESLAQYSVNIFRYQADLSDLQQVTSLAEAIESQHSKIDVIINNAGVLTSSVKPKKDEIDIRFRVNTLAPYLLTRSLMNHLSDDARVVNVASAAQAPFDMGGVMGKVYKDSMRAYAESKLALIVWTFAMARLAQNKIQFIALNPGSLLATKMVKEGFGIEGKDISIGADLLVEAALDEQFAKANGRYFDNDSQQFSQPHPMAREVDKQQQLLAELNNFV